ncbi:non-specific serine/threonine protein kinase [Trifolium repens]|nr:non-specific serine/threonine protein kinase [Trifolium repens]WJX76020.1 non-specific serine/threonine protein kinase [Trifolium repens]
MAPPITTFLDRYPVDADYLFSQFSPICSFHFNNSTPSNYRKLSRFFQLLKILVITCGRDPKRLAIGDKVLEIFVKSTPLICDTDSVTVTFTDRNSGFAFEFINDKLFVLKFFGCTFVLIGDLKLTDRLNGLNQ